MDASSKTPLSVRWLIDTHGLVEALTTESNSLRTAIVDAIETRQMLILRPASDEIKKLYEHLWSDFKAIQNRKYAQISVQVIKSASLLQEVYGSPLIGSIPTKEHFQAVACARTIDCRLVSSKNAYSHCAGIAKKCGLPANTVLTVTEFASEFGQTN